MKNAQQLIARADKYLNTGSGEYASEIMRDMAEFIRLLPTPPQCAREALIEECATIAEQWDGVDNVAAQIRRLSGKPGAEQDQLSQLRQAILDNTQGDGFWIGEILLSVLAKETGFGGPTLDEYRNNLVEQCAKVAEGTGAAMFSDSEAAAVDALRADIASGIRRLAVTRPEHCVTCGLPQSEHHYNGAAYGVCGDYTAHPRPERG